MPAQHTLDIALPVLDRLASCAPEQQWLWCAECQRFFHYRQVVYDRGDVRCPFDDCRGTGFDFDLLFWDCKREPEDARWPSCTTDLHHGLRSPDMSAFYRRRARRRHAELLAAFERSPERARLAAGGGLRFVGPFLAMTHGYAWEVDDDFFHAGLAVELLDDLPRWAERSEPARMLAELQAFWAFAARTRQLPTAALWVALLVDVTGPQAGAVAQAWGCP